MKKTISIQHQHNNLVLNICLDTLKKKKQALVFVNTKNSAEAEAERISKKIKVLDSDKEGLEQLSEKILDALEKPTKQCKRLALCVRQGIAFHHSGLHSKQRTIVEDSFKQGLLKVICATPTLAYGLNLPAFRVIVRDLKRFSGPRGMSAIPVLEYLQFCGRAGRPDFNEEYGEAICLAETENEKERIIEHYVLGEPEDILSKLAVEPVLRTYILSLIAIEFANTTERLNDFFKKTFYAHQYGDFSKLKKIIERILKSLEEWEFITIKGKEVEATLLGMRISQLYLDPYTAQYLISCMKRTETKMIGEFSSLQMVSNTLELRPLLTVRVAEYEQVEEKIVKEESHLLSLEPNMFDPEYEDYLKSIKTAMFMQDWINEMDEEQLLEKYNVRPGEVRAKLDLADWLLYSCEEMAKLIKMHGLIKEFSKMRLRLKHGAKEELMPLLRLKNIGRVRARKMFNNKIKDLEDVKKVDMTTLTEVIGKATANSIKQQVGIEIREEKIQVKKGKRKGQVSLEKY